MQIDFHYYAIYQLARLAGFPDEEARTIAYASQYVDDSTESEPVKPYPAKDQCFDTVRTAHYNLECILWDVQKKIYMPFHFLPTVVRRDAPASFSYVTQKATGARPELATMVVEEALRETNTKLRLVRIGVALHAVVDTFSHFGFSGRLHQENDVKGVWHASNGKWDFKETLFVYDVCLPKIGHVEALHYPDVSCLHWKYVNVLGAEVERENLDTCMECAERVYAILCGARSKPKKSLKEGHPADYAKMKKLFANNGALDRRCESWMAYTDAKKYDATEWRRAALVGDVNWNDMSRSRLSEHLGTLTGKKGFDASDWAFFHRAALKQRNLVLDWIN